MQQIVVGIDGSDASLSALRFAANLAEETGAAVTAVFVTETSGVWSPELYASKDFIDLEEELEKDLYGRTKRIFERGDLRWSFEVMRGYAPDEIEDLAEKLEADLIVVGSRGRRAISRFMLGSVSTRLVHASRRPVLVVHGPD